MDCTAAVPVPEKGWRNLRVVETIYEEDSGQDSPSTTPSLSSPPPPSSPSTTSLPSRVKDWSLSSGFETDVIIHVQGSSFHLHKYHLASSSGYLKRQLTESTEITLSPSLKLTPDTFSLVVGYCYGGHLFLTPFNVASLLVAADLLEMTDDSGDIENLRQKTEAYFCRILEVDRDYAAVVMRSCVALLPEAETRTGLVSRCVEALGSKRVVKGDFVSWLDGFQDLSGEDFESTVRSMHRRLTVHDFLYRIVDFYLEKNGGKMTEDDQNRICNYIDCTNLSPQLLVHAIQNPRMSLRFVVQAMCIEQLNTRRSICSVVATHHHHRHRRRHADPDAATSVTLGTILQQDAALRQAAHLKATMDSTSSRIRSLEQEIDGMRRILTDPRRSESFRFGSERKVERGQRGSVSSVDFRAGKTDGSGSGQGSPRVFGRRLMNGLKSAFRASGLGSNGRSRTREAMKVGKMTAVVV